MQPPDDVDVALPAAKQAAENLNAVERDTNPTGPTKANVSAKLPSTILTTKHTQGAPTGKPDTHTVFLIAISLSQLGKTTDNEFDREFSQLKISKPELNTCNELKKEWRPTLGTTLGRVAASCLSSSTICIARTLLGSGEVTSAL